MILTAESYDPITDTYVCRDEKGIKRRVDLLVDGGLSGSPVDDDRAWLIGRTVECDYLTPWATAMCGSGIEIAMTVRLVESTS